MNAIEFPEVNVRIAEDQPEYETLPVCVRRDEESNGFFNQVTMCFEFDAMEWEEVANSGQIWLTILRPVTEKFHPIRLSAIKPNI